MSKVNFNFFLNGYNDQCQTSAPSQNNFKWSRVINGVPYNSSISQQIQLSISGSISNFIPNPFSNVVASGNGVLNSTNQVTMTSVTGIVAGQLVVGTGIPLNTTVVSITDLVVTISNPASVSGTESLSFYNPASFFYFETDQPVSVIYNGGSAVSVNPFQINGTTQPGVYFMSGTAISLSVTNLSDEVANIFIACMG